MSAHDPRCRAQHMAVATDIDDLEGCDCALIADLRERIADLILMKLSMTSVRLSPHLDGCVCVLCAINQTVDAAVRIALSEAP